MQGPYYIFRSYENMRVHKNEKKSVWKIVVAVLCGIILVLSFIFGEFIFFELSWISRILLIGTIITVIFSDKKVFKPMPIELRFFNDRIEVFRQCVYYDRKTRKKQIYIVPYSKVTKCVFNQSANRLSFEGLFNRYDFTYDKNGVIPQKPDMPATEWKLLYFYTNADPRVNFIQEIESHSPIKIIIE